MIRIAVLGLLLALGACATTPRPPPAPSSAPVVIDDKLAVPIPCVAPTFPPRPGFTDTRAALKAAPDAAARYALMASNWEARDTRLAKDEDQIDICRAAAPPPASNGR